MTLRIDAEGPDASILDEATGRRVPLYSREGFEILSDLWLKVGWNEKYTYTFSWLGRPIIQLPEDMVRAQEIIWRTRPTVVIETGVAHGGSLVFYASLLKAMGDGTAPAGRVIGVDIEIKPHNRAAIEAHPLAAMITLIEGGSTDAAVLARVADAVGPGDRVMVVLDSNHSQAYVAAELAGYGPLVTPGCYLVAADGIMAAVADTPRGEPAWSHDNPARAAAAFAASHREFVLETPDPPFSESALRRTPTHWPGAYLRRL